MKCRVRHHTVGCADSGRRSQKLRRVRLSLITASVLALLVSSSAQASTITVGSVLPPGSSPTAFGQVETRFNTALPEKGANLVSPVTGAIVRWRVQGAEGGPFYLRVLRPNGSGAYAAVGTSGGATPSGTGVETFNANLPIHAGDLIGIDPAKATDTIGVASVPGASYGFIFPPPFDGSTVAPSGTTDGQEIALSAEVQPAPAVTSMSPASGSISGGTTVTITGTNLGGASAVKFGGTLATGFTVNSDTQITAIAPSSAILGSVDVTATTLAGTSAAVSADRFTYEGCVVPKVKGKTLKRSKSALRRADCKVGTVQHRKGKRGKVIKQNPKPGKILPPGSKVNVTVGK
jgi:IPT/TIG domain/PASTA domain